MSEPKILRLRKHCIPRPNRTASAPYNFVPLPEVVVKAVEDAEQLPDHNTYGNEDYPHTGYFDVILTTKSPLYIRCPLTISEFLRQEQEQDKRQPFREQVRNTPHFFYTRDPSEPIIPGSSLRGMLRSLLEIVSYGKVDWVMDKRLFFRTVDNTAVGIYYRDRMMNNVETGFIHTQSGKYFIRKCQVLRVHRSKLGSNLYEGRSPNKTPCWSGTYHQYCHVWVEQNGEFVERITTQPDSNLLEGRLVITGDMTEKKKEFVFLLPESNAEEITVPEELVERFHDDDQITQWQQNAFPADKPNSDARERGGMLRKDLRGEGDPVFFLREHGQLTFFGRAQMFRLPYARRPLDFVPLELRKPEDVDFADAIFGFIRTRDELADMTKRGLPEPQQGSKSRAYASRVSVTDAVLIEGESDLWLTEDPQDTIVPRILAMPKPTAFQHYLVQPEDEKSSLKHYGSSTPCETTIRGLKRYWHQELKGELPRDELRSRIEEDSAILRNIEQQEAKGNPDTQHTQFRPIRPGVRFQFRVYFENLSDRELGALCWVLHPLGSPDKEYCHHLGMGKPLGMGAVKLESVLYVTDRSERYGSLFDRGHWQMGVTGTGQQLSERSILETLAAPFEQHVLGMLKPDKPCTHLSDMKRIAILLKMMEWPGFQPDLPPTPHNRYLTDKHRSNTRYMSIMLPNASANQRNEYRDRPVLPDPSAFGELMGDAEPVPAAKANDKQQVKVIRFSKRSGNPIVKIDNRTLTVLNAPEGIQVGDMIRVDLTAISGTTIGYLDEAER